ncbi:PqqD family protein [Clostridium thermarum]|uniref:PqqD family protein n=1 Tax=Clostridium thermarum TaxID=1716543 RepID=UPI0013D29DC4|nr:PqqD family protein [Clostridium thermarum]
MKHKKKKEDNFLLYVPKRKHTNWKDEKGKVYLIFQHDKPAEKFLRWLVKKPYVTDLELDALSSSAWRIIDGKKSVYEIGQCLLKQYGSYCQPINERLIMFLRYLNKKGWISFERGKQ